MAQLRVDARTVYHFHLNGRQFFTASYRVNWKHNKAMLTNLANIFGIVTGVRPVDRRFQESQVTIYNGTEGECHVRVRT